MFLSIFLLVLLENVDCVCRIMYNKAVILVNKYYIYDSYKYNNGIIITFVITIITNNTIVSRVYRKEYTKFNKTVKIKIDCLLYNK